MTDQLIKKQATGKRNIENWSMRQVSGEAVQGFKAFLKGEPFDNNPYDTAVKYKDWAAGWRNAEDATPDQLKMFNWIYPSSSSI